MNEQTVDKKKSGIWPIALFGSLFAVVMWYSNFRTNKSIEQKVDSTAAKVQHQIDSAALLVMFIREERKQLQESLTKFAETREQIQKEENNIINNYTSIYETINTAADSVQFKITADLIAKHRATKLERK